MVLTYQDIKNIQKIGYNQDYFVIEHNGWLQLKNHNDRCIFHNGKHCTIYHHRPKGCIFYPIVYNKDIKSVILDNECPQKHCFSISKTKSRQLNSLITILEKERTKRIKNRK